MANGYRLSSMTNYTSRTKSTMTLRKISKKNSGERKSSITRPFSKGLRHYHLPSVRIGTRRGCLCWRKRLPRLMAITVRLMEAGLGISLLPCSPHDFSG